MNKLANQRPSRPNKPVIRLFLWRHRLLMLGPGFDTGLHRHHAAQWCFGLDAPLRLRTHRDGPWQKGGAFYVAPDEPHEFAGESTTTAILYMEAESAEFASLRRLLPGNAVVALRPESTALAELRRLMIVGGTVEEAHAVCVSLLDLPGAAQGAAFDPRISECLRMIRMQLHHKLRLARLAAVLRVSESWLTHRFKDEVGVPLRRYVLWQRLRRAIEMALKGSTLTAAAHAAGFSDSAHLSRTFREMFGVAPSFLFENRDHVSVSFAAS